MPLYDPLSPFRKVICDSLGKACDELGIPPPVESRADPARADMSFTTFALAKVRGVPPGEVSTEICDRLSSDGSFTVHPSGGYINFRFDPHLLATRTVESVLTLRERYGSGEERGLHAIVEHTSANPTGRLHVGRARNPIIGDTLARVLAASGYRVTREYYVNDTGKQVAMLTWGCMNLKDGSCALEDMVEGYRQASMLDENDPEVSEQISETLRMLERGEEEIWAEAERFTGALLESIFSDLKEMNVEFDRITRESDLVRQDRVADVLRRLSPHLKEEDGTRYIELEGGERFTVARSDGTSLYTLRDVAYHLDKSQRSDLMVNVLGEDQRLAMRALTRMLEFLGQPTPECVFYSMVSLPEGRMSTRAGNVVHLRDLLDEAIARARREVLRRRPGIDEGRLDRIATTVGIGAVRFNILRIQEEKSMVFRWEDALNFEGESAPYVQYAHARCMSIFRRAVESGRLDRGLEDIDPGDIDPDDVDLMYGLPLVRVIAGFPSRVRECAERRRVHSLPGQACELADAFNRYYDNVRVLDSPACTSRLVLVGATCWTLRNALHIMGIDPPGEM